VLGHGTTTVPLVNDGSISGSFLIFSIPTVGCQVLILLFSGSTEVLDARVLMVGFMSMVN
jgi:hypothetical protein